MDLPEAHTSSGFVELTVVDPKAFAQTSWAAGDAVMPPLVLPLNALIDPLSVCTVSQLAQFINPIFFCFIWIKV